MPFTTWPQVPQMPSRQSLSKAMGSRSVFTRPSLTTSSISRNDMSERMSRASYRSSLPLSLGPFWRQTYRIRFIVAIPLQKTLYSALCILYYLFIASDRKMGMFEYQRFLMQLRFPASAFVLPRRDIAEIFV